MTTKPQTIVITNFSGRLTRILNGDLNSGFAKFATSFGYNPFTKPMNLTWMERPSDVTGVNDLVLDGKVRFIGESNPTAYLIGSTGKLWKVQINSTTNNSVHSVVGIHSVLSGGATYLKGGSLEFFGVSSDIYVGNDIQVNKIGSDGSADAVVGSAANYAANVFRPLEPFAGNLVFGNGNTVGLINASGTVVSSVVGTGMGNIYSALVPPLPNTTRVQDIDSSPSNDYILMAATEVDYENISSGSTPNLRNTVPSDSKVFYWNGVDEATTAATTLSTNLLTALQSYLQSNHLFASDSNGAGLFLESKKILTLSGSKLPLPNATGVNGQFLFWTGVENYTDSNDLVRNCVVMYYYGALDQENPPGLWRVLKEFAAGVINGNVVETPFNKLVSVNYSDINPSQSSVVTVGVGTHYYSVREANSTSSSLSLKYFNVPPTGSGTVAQGVYETQTQLFSKRIGVIQVRVYCDPAVAGNKFQLDLIGADGTPVSGGTFTYTFGDITDPQSGSTAVERINFQGNIKTQYSLGVRITNKGTTNMIFRKIEVDYSEEGR